MTKVDDKAGEIFLLYVYLRFMHRFDLSSPPENWFISKYEIFAKKASHKIDIDKTLLMFNELAKPFLEKYPLKIKFNAFVTDIAKMHTKIMNSRDFIIQAGWLKERMDLSNYIAIKDYPFQTEFGIGQTKGKFKIDEDMLLKDAFNAFIKARFLFEKLKDYSNKLDVHNEIEGLDFLHFEISFYCRTSVLTFYAFIECFVNSIGYSYYQMNKETLNESQVFYLHGFKGNKYINLKKRLEKLQELMRSDNSIIVRLTDDNQIANPFKSFFDKYTGLRNSSVHNSPLKEKIWLPISEWIDIATEFSKLSIEVALLIWKTLKEVDTGPDYLSYLEYDDLEKQSEDRINSIEIAKNKMLL